MQQQLGYPSLFNGPPKIPGSVVGLAKYKLEVNSYYKRLKSITFIFIELIATLLVLGIIWINIDWVKAAVTIVAILLTLILLYLINNILY